MHFGNFILSSNVIIIKTVPYYTIELLVQFVKNGVLYATKGFKMMKCVSYIIYVDISLQNKILHTKIRLRDATNTF